MLDTLLHGTPAYVGLAAAGAFLITRFLSSMGMTAIQVTMTAPGSRQFDLLDQAVALLRDMEGVSDVRIEKTAITDAPRSMIVKAKTRPSADRHIADRLRALGLGVTVES